MSEKVFAVKRWRRVQYLTEQFWSRWRKEYLLNISKRQKWHVPRRNIKENDIVIIKEDVIPRCHWRLGRVVETMKGDDGLVRRVKVQMGDGNLTQRRSLIERPVQKVVVLIESDK